MVARFDISLRLKRWAASIERYRRCGYIRPEEIAKAESIVQQLTALSNMMGPDYSGEPPDASMLQRNTELSQ